MKAERGIREDGYGERDILLFYLAEGRRILWLLLLLGSAGRDTLTEIKKKNGWRHWNKKNLMQPKNIS
jgi:hypothetical protein